uniref:Putative secreted protein n=1 Tax=Anopheles marajoara TaxID=58244 RepID=A0A2M4CDU0_9DIPT
MSAAYSQRIRWWQSLLPVLLPGTGTWLVTGLRLTYRHPQEYNCNILGDPRTGLRSLARSSRRAYRHSVEGF